MYFSYPGSYLVVHLLILLYLSQMNGLRPITQKLGRKGVPTLRHLQAADDKVSERSTQHSPLFLPSTLPFYRDAVDLVESNKESWVLTYADLSRYNSNTLEGKLFLASNILYTIVGLATLQSQPWYSSVVEIAGFFSFLYHGSQILLGPDRNEVRMFLLFDYVFAIVSVLVCTLSFINLSLDPNIPSASLLLPLVLGLTSIAMLFKAWSDESGMNYLCYHGLWHVFSALACFEIGQLMCK